MSGSSNEYMREYMAMRYYKRMDKAITQLGGKCVKCGNCNIDELEFDHIDPSTKSFEIGKRAASISEEKLQKELSKCQLLCKKCHEKKSAADTGKQYVKGTQVHGTLSTYRYCKCDLCKKTMSAYNKKNQPTRNERRKQARKRKRLTTFKA
jgi:hypothetical protein